jgi:NitT/TauT family transport system substrate-binding protein
MLHDKPAQEIASIIRPIFFPNLKIDSYARIIDRYKAAKVWPKTTILPVESFVRLKAALLSGGLIERDIPYELVIDQQLSECGVL